MKVLVDTHIALWAITNNKQLTEKAKVILLDPENDIYISAFRLGSGYEDQEQEEQPYAFHKTVCRVMRSIWLHSVAFENRTYLWS